MVLHLEGSLSAPQMIKTLDTGAVPLDMPLACALPAAAMASGSAASISESSVCSFSVPPRSLLIMFLRLPTVLINVASAAGTFLRGPFLARLADC